ncbi:MAG: type restriction enzyme res subunit [Myxococcaceae bacterium]|nr:type restriction enzyme res subunit [Myxococcaceae bacterium]
MSVERALPRPGAAVRESIVSVPRILPDGLYEELVTDELARAIAALEPGRSTRIDAVDAAELDGVLSRHLAREIARTIAAVPAVKRTDAARELVKALLGQLAALAQHTGLDADALSAQEVAAPTRRLMSVHRGTAPDRPATPLSTSTLLTRAPSEPAIGHELLRELASADRLDVIVAFVTVGGIRRLWDRLEDFSRRHLHTGDGERLRLLTTTFTGTTEREALDKLATLPGVSVKVSYDVRRTRLHAKAWLFHRESGLSTAYVGSANLTATALGEGHEWMVKICADDMPHVLEKVQRDLRDPVGRP